MSNTSFVQAVQRTAVALLLVSFPGIVRNTLDAQTPAPAVSAAVSDLPILGIAQITNKVSNLDKSRAFYGGVLGLAEAFDLKDGAGKVISVFFKVNDDQYIELTPNLQPGELVRQGRIVVQSSDLQKLHAIYQQRGVNPGPITRGLDGNPIFRVTLPNGTNLDFLQYVAGSQQNIARGKFLVDSRLSTHILHAGTMVKDNDTKSFVADKLGFGRLLPGNRGDYIELPASDSNLETKNPPLDPKNPATLDQYTREVSGAVYHISLEVPDMRVARDLAQKRGGYDDVRVRAAMGRGLHSWLMHLFDPDGTRVEFVQAGTVDSPPLTVMAPGAPAPPIPPKANGQYGWP